MDENSLIIQIAYIMCNVCDHLDSIILDLKTETLYAGRVIDDLQSLKQYFNNVSTDISQQLEETEDGN